MKAACYRKLQSKSIRNLFVQACNHAISKLEAEGVKKHTSTYAKHFVSVIDGGMFNNYVQAAVFM